MSDLAINGGPRTRSRPLPSVSNATGRTFGAEESRAVEDVLHSGKLNRTVVADGYVASLERSFGSWLGVPEVVASTSGTAALHLSVAAIDPNPGDEIITTPITDFGTVIPIIAQNAVPVFADVDAATFCIDPESVAARITDRTRAIIAVHLFGQAADLDPLRELADAHRLTLIEDCSQSFGATYKGQMVGTLGHMATFSLQQSKHITAGDGGLTVTADPELAHRMRLFSDKGWPRQGEVRTHLFYGVNYRMTELQGAVASAQLGRLDGVIAARRHAGHLLEKLIADLPGIAVAAPPKHGESVYWLFPIVVDVERLGVRIGELTSAIQAEGIPATPGYVTPLYLTPALAEGKTYGDSHFPFDSAYTSRSWREFVPGLCPVAERMADVMFTVPINERYTDQDTHDIAAAIRKVVLTVSRTRSTSGHP